jgi:6-phosphofructokinase 2
MSAIITLTFSPCIDKSTSVAYLAPDIKMSCSDIKSEPGGGGINVSRAIHKLGGTSTAMYVSGGCAGKHFDQLMMDESINTLVISSTHETRENIIIVDASNDKQYRFGMPMSPLTADEWQQFLHHLKQAKDLQYIVVSGSLPPGVLLSIFSEISAIAVMKKARLIVDTKGDALMRAVDAGVYLIKPNLGELSALVGKKELLSHEIKDVAQSIIENKKCEVIVVSMGAEGAMLVTANFAQQIKPPVVERKSTVGAGDSMVAGIVFSLYTGKSLSQAIQYGVACGTAATLNPGTELCRKEDVEKIVLNVVITDLD